MPRRRQKKSAKKRKSVRTRKKARKTAARRRAATCKHESGQKSCCQDRESALDRLVKTAVEDALRRRTDRDRRVFIGHGHHVAALESVARWVERLGLEPVILEELADTGRTIIEKLEDCDVAFVIVLLTADDEGKPKQAPSEALESRARQSVLVELGFFLGRIGRHRACVLCEEGVAIPSVFEGVVTVPMYGDWRLRLARELKEAGLPIDFEGAI